MNARPTTGAWGVACRVMVAAAVATLVAFVACLVPPLVNSDSAAVVLLANELAKSGGWLSRDWYYVSDSLMLDGSVHAARIGVMLFGATVDAARVTVATGAVLALLAGAWLGRVLSIPPAQSLLGVCAFLLGPSLIYQDLMLGLPATFQAALVLAMLACAIRFGVQKGAPWHLVLAGALIALMSASTPKKALVYMLVPLFGGVASQWFPTGARSESSGRDHGRLSILLAASMLSWGTGSWLHALFKRDLVVNTSYAKMSLVPEPAHVLGNLKTIGELGWKFAGGGSGTLALIAAALAVACWAWIAIAPATMRRPWESLRGARGFALGSGMAGSLAIFAYLLLYERIRLYYGVYYVFATISPLFVLAAAPASGDASNARTWASRGALACLLLLGIATTAMACARFPADYLGIGKNQRSSSDDRLRAMRWLESNGYRNGFANYWDANAMTLVSGGAMQVSSLLTPSAKRVIRHRWLIDRARSNYVPGNESWFIAIGTARRNLKLPAKCLPADRTLVIASYRLYLYDRAMPGCLPPPVKPRRG